MIDFIESAMNHGLRSRDVASELARHFPDRDATQVRAVADAVIPFLGGLVHGLRFMVRAAHDSRAGRAVAFANGQILGYVLDDRDLLSEQELGPLGQLDDAYLFTDMPPSCSRSIRGSKLMPRTTRSLVRKCSTRSRSSCLRG